MSQSPKVKVNGAKTVKVQSIICVKGGSWLENISVEGYDCERYEFWLRLDAYIWRFCTLACSDCNVLGWICLEDSLMSLLTLARVWVQWCIQWCLHRGWVFSSCETFCTVIVLSSRFSSLQTYVFAHVQLQHSWLYSDRFISFPFGCVRVLRYNVIGFRSLIIEEYDSKYLNWGMNWRCLLDVSVTNF